jgi:hypothetical protein
MQKATLIFSAALLVAASSAHGRCLLHRAGPEPEWVRQLEVQPGDDIIGVGDADARNLDASAATQAARAKALQVVAEQIRVNIESEIRLSNNTVTQGARSLISHSLTQVVTATTQVTLKNFTQSDVWFDRANCRAWVRVKLSATELDATRKREAARAMAGQVRASLEQAADKTLPAARRREAWVAAEFLIEHTDFTPATDVVVEALKVRLADAAAHIRQAEADERTMRQLLGEYQAALANFNKATTPSTRQAAASQAAAPLRKLLSLGPERLTALSDSPAVLLIHLLTEAGWPCEAKDTLEKWPLSPQQIGPERFERVREAKCGTAERSAERNAQALAGRHVVLVCGIQLSERIAPWPKACSKVSQAMTSIGAHVEVRSIDALTDLKKKPQLTVGGTLYIRLFAEGRINTRRRTESASAPQNQFEGIIRTSLVSDGDAEWVDEYAAKTGWNPASIEMTVDVLGINAASRLLGAVQDRWYR